jgi:hypothetical protein
MYSAYDHLAVGLPHSDIRGSTIARISPRLFAACYVLHRLLVPRHPPNALQRLISTFPRNHPSPCEPERPISLLIPRQPRQPPQDARTHNSVPFSHRPESRSSACRHEVLTRNSPSNTRRSSRSRHIAPSQDRSPRPPRQDRRFQVKASVPSSPCQTAQSHRPEPAAPSASSTTPGILYPYPSEPTAPSSPPRSTALVEADGIEPTTPCLQSRCSPTELRPQPRASTKGSRARSWWAREDLNFRPHAYQARALTN